MIKSCVLSFVLIILCGQWLAAQEKGCTDPRATNYSSDAIINDGSCVYAETQANPEKVIDQLPLSINEGSGMLLFNGLLWFHNDSGDEARLYGLDSLTNAIVATVEVQNASHIDWEDITHDSLYVYVGDVGNNAGDRKDLRIYKLHKSQFPAQGNAVVSAEVISFSYSDQSSFVPANQQTNFDCEAILSFEDSLYLFSKNWLNEKTKVYRLPKTSGTYIAMLIDSFDVDGLITAADYHSDHHELVLLGYKNFKPFFWLLFDFKSSAFFSGNKRRIDFPITYLGSQTEAVLFCEKDDVYISTEKNALVTNKLLRVYTWHWTKPLNLSVEEATKESQLVFPNPNSGIFSLHLPVTEERFYEITIYDSSGQLVYHDVENDVSISREITVDLGKQSAGQYHILIKTGRNIIQQTFQILK
jgi:hypothetical protein